MARVFARPGDTFKQHMAVGEEGYKERFHKVFLTDDGLVHPSGNQIYEISFTCNEVVKVADVNRFTHNVLVL